MILSLCTWWFHLGQGPGKGPDYSMGAGRTGGSHSDIGNRSGVVVWRVWQNWARKSGPVTETATERQGCFRSNNHNPDLQKRTLLRVKGRKLPPLSAIHWKKVRPHVKRVK